MDEVRAFCPNCGADLALDAEARVQKRADCAACGRAVELAPELLGSFSSALDVPPASGRVTVDEDGSMTLRGATGAQARIAIEGDHLTVTSGRLKLFPNRVWLESIEEIRAHDPPFSFAKRTHFAGGWQVYIDCGSEGPIDVGADVGLDAGDADWLARRLARDVRRARLADERQGSTDLGDQMSTCGSCGREVRITGPELLLGKSFCASCGADFRVSADTLGEAPHRQIAVVQTRITGQRRAPLGTLSDGGFDLGAAPDMGAKTRLAVICFGGSFVLLFLVKHSVAAIGLAVALFCLGFYKVSVKATLHIDGDSIVVGDGPFGLRRRRVLLADLRDVSIAQVGKTKYSAVLELCDGTSVCIGGPLGISRDAASFLRDEILEKRETAVRQLG